MPDVITAEFSDFFFASISVPAPAQTLTCLGCRVPWRTGLCEISLLRLKAPHVHSPVANKLRIRLGLLGACADVLGRVRVKLRRLANLGG
jgi:hypothetical protein